MHGVTTRWWTWWLAGWLALATAAAQGRDVPWTTSKVRGRPTPPAPFRVELAFPQLKFERPTCLVEIPGSDELLVAHGSRLEAFAKRQSVAQTRLVGDLAQVTGGAVSIHHVAFHPDFADNRFVFVSHRHHAGGPHHRVSRYTLSGAAQPTVLPGSERPILTWPAGGHGGGCIAFAPDGLLYISTGDGTGPAPPDGKTTGQDIRDLLGSVLRIDVDHQDDGKNYRIPADNPFVLTKGARAEIYSYGLRNPWKFGVDAKTGNVFVADNGWETWEMIHLLHRGSNCGWPIMEGRAQLRTEVAPGPTQITPPIKDHHHSEANSVIGGPIYRGQALPGLHGAFLYGDYIMGTIWALTLDADGEVQHRTLTDTELHIVAFAETSGGEVYVLDYDQTGQVYQLLPDHQPDTSAHFPRKLSQTGLFASLAPLLPAEGVLPYALSAEPWSDGARAKRFVAIPGAGTIELDAVDPRKSHFPEGTVLVKHLVLGTERNAIETQLLHLEAGTWRVYSYLWDEAGQDATLVPTQGADREISTAHDPAATRTWHAGAENECRLCHNTASGPVLGFTLRQLDRPAPGHNQNQLDRFTEAGLFAARPRAADLPALVDPHRETASLNDRARSYLHVNCGICHHESGPATISFFAHRDYPFDTLRITKRPGIGMFGIQSPRLVNAGAPYRSIILYRLSKLGYGRMPYVGSRAVDSRGVDLIARWIDSLPADHNADPPGVAAQALQPLAAGQDTSAAALDALLQTTEGALALSTAWHRGQLTPQAIEHVLAAAPKTNGDIRGVFDHFLPESQRRATLGLSPDPQQILALSGNGARGKLIFHSDNARCRACHDEASAEASVGPTLAAIRMKYKRRGELLRHILQPSAAMDEKFTTWTVLTDGGEVVSGLLEARTATQLTLKLADKSRRQFALDALETVKPSARSVMPDGVLGDLTPQQAADLLEFLLPGSSP